MLVLGATRNVVEGGPELDDRADWRQQKSALVLNGGEVVRLNGRLVGGLSEIVIELLLNV